MHQMPFTLAPPPEPKKSGLKPWLQLALTLAVLAFCATLWLR